MKKLYVLLISLMLSTSSHAVGLLDIDNSYCFRPYVGAEVQYKTVNFEKGFNESRFSHKAPQAHLFGGIAVGKNIAVEVGAYQSQQRLHKGASTKARTRAHKITFLKYFPIADTNFSLVTGLGLSQISALLEHQAPNFQKVNIQKGVTHVKMGLHKMIDENLAIRMGAIWENTTHIKSDVHGIKGKDSISYSLGTIWYF